MLRLKSRNTLPKDGFQFFEPNIPNATYPPMIGFEAMVEAIIAKRKANPRLGLSTNKAAVGDELDLFNAKRLESMPRCQGFLISEEGQPVPKFHARSQPPTPHRSGAVSAGIKSAVAGVKRLTVGFGVLLKWLGGDARPVPTDLAEKRAAVCVDCPLNKPANLYQWVYGKGAEAIESYLQLKNDQSIKTTLDSKLFACQACDCHLGLKVHCPIEHILSWEKQEPLAKLDPRCWILKEKEATNQ
jgi:hypothetical protein